jgi:hypothetical protein
VGELLVVRFRGSQTLRRVGSGDGHWSSTRPRMGRVEIVHPRGAAWAPRSRAARIRSRTGYGSVAANLRVDERLRERR